MRHQKKTLSFGRKKDPKRALFKGLIQGLILYERIETTEAKAKALKPKMERMVTKARKDTLYNRRGMMKKIPTKSAVKKLFEVLGPKYEKRKGGYLRIVKSGTRKGDGARMAIIEFV